MARVDIAATINNIGFPDEIWGWLDLLGEVISVTEHEASSREHGFVADTPYKKVLVGGVHSHLSGQKAVYFLLRSELVSQAAGQARLLCAGVIALNYIAENPQERSVSFLDYSTIEAYEAAEVHRAPHELRIR